MGDVGTGTASPGLDSVPVTPTAVPSPHYRRGGEPLRARTDVILDAVRAALQERRALFDGALDLGEVTISVKLHAGTNVVKALIVTDERVRRRV